LAESGYRLTLVDVDQPLLDALNARGSYTIQLATNDGIDEVSVGPVRASTRAMGRAWPKP